MHREKRLLHSENMEDNKWQERRKPGTYVGQSAGNNVDLEEPASSLNQIYLRCKN